MEVDIVGEDDVTRAILERLIISLRKDIIICRRLPHVQGGRIKNQAPKFNLLGLPVILLTDQDVYNCAPELIIDWFGHLGTAQTFLFNVACEEAETWLMADREGFSSWLGIDIHLIPQPCVIDPGKNLIEVTFPIKPSLFMMRELVSASSNDTLKKALSPLKGAKKGPAYNEELVPFVYKNWDFNNASKNSSSLSRIIERLKSFSP